MYSTTLRISAIFLLFHFCLIEGKTQCLIPSDNGDTLTPVINRMTNAFTSSNIEAHREYVYRSAVMGNTAFVAGSFNYIGPNTGAGVIIDSLATEVKTPKKWRINGPVLASVPDGNGGYYIGGNFTKIGDSSFTHLAHINGNGVPYNWHPQLDDAIEALAMNNDTLFIGGIFNFVNGQRRNGLASINKISGDVHTASPWISQLDESTQIHTFLLVDSILYVGGKENIYNHYSFFKINIRTGDLLGTPDMYQMGNVYSIAVSEDKKKIYIGGNALNGLATHNGFCIDPATNALLYIIEVGSSIDDDHASIYSLKTQGKNVYAGGYFDFGNVNGNAFNKNGIIVFDTASGQIRNYLNGTNGIIFSVHTNNNKVYLGGEFTTIDGQQRKNFAIFDTVSKTITYPNSMTVSDRIMTISFSGGDMFTGGYFQSWNGVSRNSYASYDMVTGQINSWQPSITTNELNQMKLKGDTLFLAGSFNTGAIAALNTTTGATYPVPNLGGSATDLLFSGDYLYVSGANRSATIGLVKINLPTLTHVSTWKPNPSIPIRSINKRDDKIYAVGYEQDRGYVMEINDNAGTLARTVELNPDAVVNDLNWISGSVLAGNKLFICGNFNKILGSRRKNLAVVNVDDWSLSPIDVNVSEDALRGGIKFINGNVVLYGSFDSVNHQAHRYVAVIDTLVGAVFPDRLHLNNDDPVGYSFDDFEFSFKVNTLQLANNKLLIGGSFRNVNGKMFPSLAKLDMLAGNPAPATPQGISGPDTIDAPSQNNIYSIINSDPDLRYAWFYTGADATIRNNGSNNILLNVGGTATPGQLKAIALSECGRSDTVRFDIHLRTSEPTINASNLSITRYTDTTATIKFTRGNGARRIVVVKAINNITDLPQDKQEYNADNNLGLGSDLGNNTFIVYKGTGDSVNIRTLNPETLYYVSVVEFNGADTVTNYLVTGNPTISFTTDAAQPTIQASNISFSNIGLTSFTIDCTPGNGQKRLIVIRRSFEITNTPVDRLTYTPNTVFGSGAMIANLTYVVSNTSAPVTVTGLEEAVQYAVSVFEFNGNGVQTNYLLANNPVKTILMPSSEPTIQATNITVTNIAGTTATINFTPGNGTSRIVVVREDNPIIDVPVDGVQYTNSNVFGLGSTIGNNTFVVATTSPSGISNLRPGHTYYIKVFEKNGSGTSSNYLLTNPPTASFTTTITAPTLPASGINIGAITTISAFTSSGSGNGTNRIFVIRSGSAITDVPVDGIDYTANASFGFGSDLGNNSFVIAKGFNTTILNLLPNTTYHLKVFEYNGTGTATRYLIAGAPTRSFTTLAGAVPEPTIQATNLFVTNMTGNTATINCTGGNGAHRLVVIREGTSITSLPVDGVSYNANTNFGMGSDLGNQTFVISNHATPVTVTGLSLNTNYTVSIFEFNGSGSLTNFMNSNSVQFTFSTSIVLPVTLADFSATANSCNAIINWKTLTEDNVAKFEIQYSANSTNFETVGTVTAKNNPVGATYKFANNQGTGRGYYRLKTVDRDGKFNYSKIIAIDTKCLGNKTVIIYPNPVTSDENLSLIVSGYQGVIKGELVNMSGQVVKKYVLMNGLNKLPIDKVGQASYIIRLSDATGNIESFKILIIK